MSESVAPASRKSLKVNVESVEIPVEKDGSILLSTLQSAFPGAHGLYFFDGSSKHAVKYDGKDAKIIAPEDGWNERAYYTSLAHSRQAWQPYGSYENASKQFERSVNAVQRMLGGFDSTVGVGQGERQPIKQVVALPQQKSVPLPQLDSKLPDNGVKNLLNALTSPAPQRYTKLTSSDQQIVDLAKLVTAKDAIVEQQRAELKATENDLASTSAKLKDRETELTQERARIEAQNHELEILRALAKEQTYLCSQVQTLTKENQSLSKDLVDKDKQIEHENEIKENLEKALRVMKDEKAALENEVHSLRGQLELSAHRLSELELLAAAVGVDDGQAVKTYAQLQNDFASSNSQLEELAVVKANLDKDLSESQSKIEELNQLSASLAAENSALSQKSSELESKCASIERHLTTLEQKWTTKITERTDHLTTEKQALEEEVNDLRSRQSELTALTDRLASEALRASERAKQTELEKDELKKQLEAVDNVWQEKLAAEKNYCKEETDYLRSDLSESQKRVAELTTLIDRFATDARNHERLVIDML